MNFFLGCSMNFSLNNNTYLITYHGEDNIFMLKDQSLSLLSEDRNSSLLLQYVVFP